MNAKQRSIEMIQRLPDSATFEDIMEGVYVIAQIEEGLRDIEAARVIPHAEVIRRISKLLESFE